MTARPVAPVAPLVEDLGCAKINLLLGGILRGALVLVEGSEATAAAAWLASAACLRWGAEGFESRTIFWLDTDPLRPSLAEDVGDDVFWKQVRAPEPGARRLASVLGTVPAGGRVLVVHDATRASARDLRALRAHGAWLKLLVAPGAGPVDLPIGAFDARVTVGASESAVLAQTWAPLPEVAARTYHPLFPRSDGRPDVERPLRFIGVMRRDAAAPRGHRYVAWSEAPETLRSWADVGKRFGDGDYKVVAKDALHRAIRFAPQGWQTVSGFGVRQGPTEPVPPRRLDLAEVGRLLVREGALAEVDIAAHGVIGALRIRFPGAPTEAP